MADRSPVLLIACGALATEASALLKQVGLQHVTLTCLPAKLHNTPQDIPGRLREKIREKKTDFAKILVLYGDCGTAGGIDQVLQEEGATRIQGAHCYEFFAGERNFKALSEAEPGTFYLTDFLARHFEKLVWEGLGLDAHPELLPLYFGNYSRLMYLSQIADPDTKVKAQDAAKCLGLRFEQQETGLSGIESFLRTSVQKEETLCN